MKSFRLILITENQKSFEKGRKFAETVCEILDCQSGFDISKYHKLKNSYRIEIVGEIMNQENAILESIELTDRICSPWQIKYDRDEKSVELIFNKSDHSLFRHERLNVLYWSNFVVESK